MPQLNVRGTAQALDYEVQAYALGPLEKRQLILRSDPPLPQDSLIQLLTTGMAPGVYAGTGPGETPGSGSLTPLRAFGRKFEPQGFRTDSAMSGLRSARHFRHIPGDGQRSAGDSSFGAGFR